MRISDWSSDVCSSDLQHLCAQQRDPAPRAADRRPGVEGSDAGGPASAGRAERVERADRLSRRGGGAEPAPYPCGTGDRITAGPASYGQLRTSFTVTPDLIRGPAALGWACTRKESGTPGQARGEELGNGGKQTQPPPSPPPLFQPPLRVPRLRSSWEEEG